MLLVWDFFFFFNINKSTFGSTNDCYFALGPLKQTLFTIYKTEMQKEEYIYTRSFELFP